MKTLNPIAKRDRQERTRTVNAVVKWIDAGCGSGGHLAETLGVKPSREIQHLANVLTCASDSAEVKRMLAELAN